MKFLGRFDYKPDQAFPDNMTKGPNRITGNVKAGTNFGNLRTLNI